MPAYTYESPTFGNPYQAFTSAFYGDPVGPYGSTYAFYGYGALRQDYASIAPEPAYIYESGISGYAGASLGDYNAIQVAEFRLAGGAYFDTGSGLGGGPSLEWLDPGWTNAVPNSLIFDPNAVPTSRGFSSPAVSSNQYNIPLTAAGFSPQGPYTPLPTSAFVDRFFNWLYSWMDPLDHWLFGEDEGIQSGANGPLGAIIRDLGALHPPAYLGPGRFPQLPSQVLDVSPEWANRTTDPSIIKPPDINDRNIMLPDQLDEAFLALRLRDKWGEITF